MGRLFLYLIMPDFKNHFEKSRKEFWAFYHDYFPPKNTVFFIKNTSVNAGSICKFRLQQEKEALL